MNSIQIPEKEYVQYQQLQADHRQLSAKIAELESDRKEHGLVVNALTALEGDRKCWRMVGGVLIEKRVDTVLPTLEDNTKQIDQLLEEFSSRLEKQRVRILDFQRKYGLMQQETHDSSEKKETGGESKNADSAHGVLV